jgi:DUF2934 family protein
MSELNDAIVRARAHALWEASGQPQGRHEEFWLQAESELKDDPQQQRKTRRGLGRRVRV